MECLHHLCTDNWKITVKDEQIELINRISQELIELITYLSIVSGSNRRHTHGAKSNICVKKIDINNDDPSTLHQPTI